MIVTGSGGSTSSESILHKVKQASSSLFSRFQPSSVSSKSKQESLFTKTTIPYYDPVNGFPGTSFLISKETHLTTVMRQKFGLSSHLIKDLVHRGRIYVNNQRIHGYRNCTLKEGSIVTLPLDLLQERRAREENEKVDKANVEIFDDEARILYEDEELLFVHKPAGMAVHAGKGVNNEEEERSLQWWLRHVYRDQSLSEHVDKQWDYVDELTLKADKDSNMTEGREIDGGLSPFSIECNSNVEQAVLSSSLLKDSEHTSVYKDTALQHTTQKNFSDAMRAQRPSLHLLHRLDMDASGVLMLAKGRDVARMWQTRLRDSLIDEQHIEKLYVTMLIGSPKERRGTITSMLYEGNKQPMTSFVQDRAFITDEGKVAISQYHQSLVLERRLSLKTRRRLKLSQVEWVIRTGRKHQIRVHAAEQLGCPVLGDRKYAYRECAQLLTRSRLDRPKTVKSLSTLHEPLFYQDLLCNRLHLHCRAIRVKNYLGEGQDLIVESPLPWWFGEIKEVFKVKWSGMKPKLRKPKVWNVKRCYLPLPKGKVRQVAKK